MQDEITEAIIAAIELQLYARKFSRQAQDAGQQDAWDLVMRALSHYWRVTRQDNVVAQALLEKPLLADYAEHPRTVLLSTHQVDEAAGLLERVVVMDQGRIVLDAAADDLRGAATRVSGPVLAVEEFTVGHPVWDRRRMGSQETAVIACLLGEADRGQVRTGRLTLEPLSLQELVAHAADRPTPYAQKKADA